MKIKPPTKNQMKIKRRKNSVLEITPDRNQRRITSMFGPTQKNMMMEHFPVEAKVIYDDDSNELSEPNQKRPRISEHARVSDSRNDTLENNPDFDSSESQSILTKSLE